MNIKSLLIGSAAALAAVSGAMAADIVYDSSGKCTLAKPDMVAAASVDTVLTASTQPKYGIDIAASEDPGPKMTPQFAERDKLPIPDGATIAALPAWDDDGTFFNVTNLS